MSQRWTRTGGSTWRVYVGDADYFKALDREIDMIRLLEQHRPGIIEAQMNAQAQLLARVYPIIPPYSCTTSEIISGTLAGLGL